MTNDPFNFFNLPLLKHTPKLDYLTLLNILGQPAPPPRKTLLTGLLEKEAPAPSKRYSSEEIADEIRKILRDKWETRDGEKIPEAEDLKLSNDGVKLDGTVLYADLVDSTGMVESKTPEFAAEVYKAFLIGACRVIRNNGGEIIAFDGDRVMAAYIGKSKNTSAAKSALQINRVVVDANASLKVAYPDTAFTIRHVVGIDTSSLFVAKTGVRNSNDLVWVGRAANRAAKLCTIREENYATYITPEVFNVLAEEAKLDATTKALMWESHAWTGMNNIPVYRSSWYWGTF